MKHIMSNPTKSIWRNLSFLAIAFREPQTKCKVTFDTSYIFRALSHGSLHFVLLDPPIEKKRSSSCLVRALCQSGVLFDVFLQTPIFYFFWNTFYSHLRIA